MITPPSGISAIFQAVLAVNCCPPRTAAARQLFGEIGPRHAAVGFDRQQLRRPEPADAQARAVDGDVAHVVRKRHGPHGVAAAGRQADQRALGAGDVQQVGRPIVRNPARRRADRAPAGDGPGRDVDADDGAAAAKRDVRAAGAVFDDAARFVTRSEHHGGDAPGGEVDDVDAIAIGIGRHRRVAVAHHAQRAAADRGRRHRLRRGWRRTGAGTGTCAKPGWAIAPPPLMPSLRPGQAAAQG